MTRISQYNSDNILKSIICLLIQEQNLIYVIVTRNNSHSIELGKQFKNLLSEVPLWLVPAISCNLSTHITFSNNSKVVFTANPEKFFIDPVNEVVTDPSQPFKDLVSFSSTNVGKIVNLI